MLLKTSFALLLIASVFTQADPSAVPLMGVPSTAMPTPMAANQFAPAGQIAPASPNMPTNSANPSSPADQGISDSDKAKYALLSADKQNLTEADLSSIFQKDLTTLGSNSSGDAGIDSDCSDKLNSALKATASDPNALAFIFTQATQGSLCKMLGQNQGDVDAAMKGFKDTEGFTPVANNNAPAAPIAANNTPAAINNNSAPAAVQITPPTIPASDASNNPTTNTGNSVNTSNNTDPKVAADQSAKQAQQMQQAQDAINNLFAQVGTRMNTNQAMPNISFGAPDATSNPGMAAIAPNADLGAGLARVPATA